MIQFSRDLCACCLLLTIIIVAVVRNKNDNKCTRIIMIDSKIIKTYNDFMDVYKYYDEEGQSEAPRRILILII